MSNQNMNINFTATANFSPVLSSVNQVKNALNGIKLPPDLTSKIKNSMSDLENSTKKVQTILSKGIHTKADSNALHKAIQEMDRDSEKLQKDINKINNSHIKVSVEGSEKVKELGKNLEEARKKSEQFKTLTSADYLKGIEKYIRMDRNTALKDKYLSFKDALKTGDSSKIIAEAEKVSAHLRKVGDSLNNTAGMEGRGDTLIAFFRDVAQSAGYSAKEVNNLEKELKEVVQAEAAAQKGNLRNLASNMRANYMDTARGLQQSRQEAEKFNSQMGMLQSSADYFFGLQNMFYLMRRGVRDTLETVKELDKAMTETAVVTDRTVGDLWNQLPDYTDLANKLGATTKGAYETMTLYYQQGLEKDQTFEIGEETMKMARIAGLDYAETTNMMTAALRGFNMELNQDSAKKVNDVYSKLAAITASDTKEIGSAMERTASIAHSANMDFETTSAFLAQMIETTREAPENLGTAMKTIIARFQELKENPMEIGEVEGEEVSFNRVDKALKTIGVQLVDSKDKFRDLDDVFLEIASKWDGLTQTQQRYIATTAAGSRQQSRFIAMMNNYKRTLELVDAAKNSEGASDVQFSKTLDSMESKLNQLHNAWDNFMMGITNNKFLKWAVDMGTTFIGTIDKIISGISKMTGPFEDFTRSFLSLGALGIGLKAGGKLVNTGLGMVGNLIDPSRKGSMFGGMTGRRDAGDAQLASQINTPIVNVLNSILNVVSKGRNNPNGSKNPYGDYQKARQDVYKSLVGKDEAGNRKQFNLKDIQKNTKELDSQQTGVLYKSNPILGRATGRLFAQALNTPEASKETQRALKTYALNIQKQMDTGALRTKEGFYAGTNRLKAATQLGGSYEAEIKKAVLTEARSYLASRPEIREKINKVAEQKGLGKYTSARQEFLNNAYSKYYEYQRSQEAQNNNTTNLSRLESGALRVGNAANSAGQAVMGLGMAFNAAGFTTAGGMLTSIGSGIQGIGMAAQGAATLVSKFSSGILSFVKANPVVAGLGAAAAAIGLIYYSHQDYIKGIRKEGKKVEKDYERTTDRTTKNISKLQEYKSDFDKLSQGVDSNGYNIDLGTEEYKDYQKIVKDLIKINPSLVKGYNAQGQAIIDKNKAIEESIKVQEEEKKKAEDEYTSSESLDKLIKARNTKKRFDYKYQDEGEAGSRVGGATGAYGTMDQFTKDSESIIRNIRSLGEAGEDVLDELNKQYGVDFREINEEGIRVLQQHGSEILDRVKQDTEGAVGVTDDKISNIQDSIATLGKHTEGFDKVVEPVYKALSTYISKQDIFKNIPEEFQSTLDASIKEIAGKKFTVDGSELSGSEMQEMARNAANQIQNLKGHGDDYRKVLEEVDEAQKQFGKDLDVGEYEAKIDPLISKLQNWKKDFESSGSVVDQSIAEMLNNKIEELKNFTTESSTTLAEGFNTMSSNISSANKVLERYQEAQKKGDYYTASDNFKQVYEDISSKKNWAGEGSLSFEAGAMEMVGEKNFFKLNTKELKKQVEEVGSFFTEDTSGINNFIDTVKSKLDSAKLDESIFGKKENGEYKTVGDFIKINEKGGLNFDKIENFDDAKMAEMASALGMSLDAFTAILNKARQFSNINFSNTNQLKQALATSESTITGLVDGEKKLYTRRSTFMQEAREAGVGKDEANDRMNELSKQGFVFVKDASQTTAKEISSYIKGWGIEQKNGAATTEDFLRKFDQLQYNKEEIETLYETATKKGLISDKEEVNMGEVYSKLLTEKQAPEMTVLNTIESEVSAISSKLDIRNGILTDEAKDKYKDVAFKNGETREKVWEAYDKKGKYNNSVNFRNAENAINQGIKETNNTIEELKAMKENATDDATKNSIDKLITRASERKEEYELWKSRQQDKWEKINKSAYEDTGIKLKGQDERIARENGVDLRNAWNGSNIITSMNRLLDFTRNNSISKEGKVDLAHQFYNDQKSNVTNIDDFQNLRNGLLKLAPKDDKLIAALSKLETSIKDNTKKQDKNTKEEGEKRKEGQRKEVNEETPSKPEQPSSKSNTPPPSPTTIPSILSSYISKSTSLGGLQTSLDGAFSAYGRTAQTGLNWMNANEPSLKGLKPGEFSAIRRSLDSIADEKLSSKLNGLNKSINSNSKKVSENSKETSKSNGRQKNNNNNNKNNNRIIGSNGRINPKSFFEKGMKNVTIKGAKIDTKPKSNPSQGIFTKPTGKITGGTMVGGAIVGRVKTKTEDDGKEDKTKKLKNRTVTIKVKVSTKGVSEKIKNINSSIKKLTNKSKTIKIKVKNNTKEGLKGIKDSLKDLTGKQKKITITSNAKEVMSKIVALLNKAKEINSTRPVLKIDSEFDDSAVEEARGLDNVTLATAYVHIKVKDDTKGLGKGKGGKKEEESDSKEQKWTGTRNTLPVSPSLSFNSAANGLNNGIKKAKKGTRTTLTGEKGYEVAWLPSESRSTILGLKGPEIVDLPRDAVIYNHDQSKKIVKGNKNRPTLDSASDGKKSSKRKPLGRDVKGDLNEVEDTGDGKKTPSTPDKTTTQKTTTPNPSNPSNSSNNSDNDKGKKKGDELAKKFGKVTEQWWKKTGKISSWWDNIKRKVEATMKVFNKAVDKFSKYMDKSNSTAEGAWKRVEEMSKKAATSAKPNIQAYKKAVQNLKLLSRGPLSKTQKKLLKYQALKSKGKKRTPKEEKTYKRLKKELSIKKNPKPKKPTKPKKPRKPKKPTKKKMKKFKKQKKQHKKAMNKYNNQMTSYKKAVEKFKKTKQANKKKYLKNGKLTRKGKKAYKKAKRIDKKNKKKKTGNWKKVSWQENKTVYSAAGKKVATQIKKYKKMKKGKAKKKLGQKLKKLGFLGNKGKVTKKGKKVLRNVKYAKQYKALQAFKKMKKPGKNASKKDKEKYRKAKARARTARNKLKKAGLINKKGKLTSKGKKRIKIDKKTKKMVEKVDFSKYIKFDKETGAYVIDDKKLNKVKNKKKKKAIQEKANQLIDDYQQKRDEAQENLEQEKEQFIDSGYQIYEQFYSWESSLRKIDTITEKIAKTQAKAALDAAALELALTGVRAGILSITEGVNQVEFRNQQRIANNERIIELSKNKKEQAKRDEKAAVSANDERQDFNIAIKKRDKVQNEIDALIKEYNGDTLKAREDPRWGLLYSQLGAAQAEVEDTKNKTDAAEWFEEHVQKTKNSDGTITYSLKQSDLDDARRSGNFTSEDLSYIESLLSDANEAVTTFIEAEQDAVDAAADTAALAEEIAQQQSEVSQELVQVLERRAQQQIDKLSAIDEGIKNGNQKIFDALNKNLQQRRQEKQNEKTEKNLSDKQSKLAFLRADTAGGHQIEIAELEKQITEDQESYQESLEDQHLQALQDLAELSNQQRERQISILQEQLEYNKEVGTFVKTVDAWLKNPENFKITIKQTLTDSALDGNAKTEATKAAAAATAAGKTVETIANKNVQGTLGGGTQGNKGAAKAQYDTVEKGNKGNPPVDESKKTVQSMNLKKYKAAEEKLKAAIKSRDINKITAAQKEVSSIIKDMTTEEKKNVNYGLINEGNRVINEIKAAAAKAAKEKPINDYNNQLAATKRNGKLSKEEFAYGWTLAAKAGVSFRQYMIDLAKDMGWQEVFKAFKAADKAGKMGSDVRFDVGRLALTYDTDNYRKQFRKYFNADYYTTRVQAKAKGLRSYKTGGLADYTGPAWLDGTKTKPELVLNAKDTENFLALKDTLSQIKNQKFPTQSTGDVMIDVDINVDKLESDYDVKKVAKAVEKEIVKSANYRNVNIVRKMK